MYSNEFNEKGPYTSHLSFATRDLNSGALNVVAKTDVAIVLMKNPES
jgi:hypothetical protein